MYWICIPGISLKSPSCASVSAFYLMILQTTWMQQESLISRMCSWAAEAAACRPQRQGESPFSSPCLHRFIPHSSFGSQPNAKFSGDTSLCKGFLLQCLMYFASFVGMPEPKVIARFMNVLTSKVLKWAIVVWEQRDEYMTLYEQFTVVFPGVFDRQNKSGWWAAPVNKPRCSTGCGVCSWVLHNCGGQWMERCSPESFAYVFTRKC